MDAVDGVARKCEREKRKKIAREREWKEVERGGKKREEGGLCAVCCVHESGEERQRKRERSGKRREEQRETEGETRSERKR